MQKKIYRGFLIAYNWRTIEIGKYYQQEYYFLSERLIYSKNWLLYAKAEIDEDFNILIEKFEKAIQQQNLKSA